MRKVSVSLIVAATLVLGIFGLIQHARGQQGDTSTNDWLLVRREVEGENSREIWGPAHLEKPSIGFIDSPTPYCYQPDAAQDECLINWASISVEGTPANMEVMTVTLKAIGPVARYQGYFQDSIHIPHGMNGTGFQVACGAPGAGGMAQMGNSYDWTIEAEDTNGLVATNSGTLYCPPHSP